MIKKISVLHILPSLSRGGAERVAVDILKNLDQTRFAPALLLFKDNKQGEELKAELAAAGVPVISLHKRLLIDPLNIALIIRAVAKLKPDIIHTHLGGDIYGILAGKLQKVPVIVSTEHNINQSAKKSAELVKKINLKSVTKIFAVSNAVREDAINRYHLKPEKITVVYNGIDSNRFDPSKVSDWLPGRTDGEKVIIGAIGQPHSTSLAFIKALGVMNAVTLRSYIFKTEWCKYISRAAKTLLGREFLKHFFCAHR